MTRVVFLDHSARLSGAELALLHLLPALAEVEPTLEPVVVLAEDGPLATRLAEAGVAVEVLAMGEEVRDLRRHRVGAGGLREVVAPAIGAGRHALRLRSRLRAIRPDLVHTWSLKSSLYGGVAGRLAGIPVVWSIQDRIAEDYLPPRAVRLVRGAARVLPTAITANSEATRATLGAAAARATVVHPPVPALDPVAPGDGSARPFTVGIVGRLTPWKGQHRFLEAFARAFPDPSGPERAVVVGAALFGEEDYAAGLPGRVAALGLGGRVELTGFRSDVAAELARLDVLVSWSTVPEPFGMVVVEGMAAGLAVVAADAGGPSEIITDSVDGLLVPPGDEAALADALRALAADPDRRRRLAEAARRRAADFAPVVAARSLVALYGRILHRR